MSPTTPTKQAQPTNTTQTAPTPQPTPAANDQQKPEIKDEDLLNLLQQKMADQKFQQAFAQWLKTQQQQHAA